ncbi:MAG: hypothetical protein AAFU61_04680 [Pseudomonadota bacterium]
MANGKATKHATVDERVAGGVITKDASSGRLVSVTTSQGVSRPSKESRRVIEGISNRRSAALARLADR